MKSFTILEGVFKTGPYFVFGCTGEELKKHVKKTHAIDIEAPKSAGTQITVKDKSGTSRILWVPEVPNRPEIIGRLVHEIFHLVVRICRDKGVPIVANIETGECGDETAAYLMEYFYIECMKRLRSKKSPTPKKNVKKGGRV